MRKGVRKDVCKVEKRIKAQIPPRIEEVESAVPSKMRTMLVQGFTFLKSLMMSVSLIQWKCG